MVNYNESTLDTVFAALADRTRRGVIASLANGSRSVSELADPFDMSLPGFVKHLQVLESAGLITREKHGRIVSCSLQADVLEAATDWLARYRAFWEPRMDALARFLEQQEGVTPQARGNDDPAASTEPKPPRKRTGKRAAPRRR